MDLSSLQPPERITDNDTTCDDEKQDVITHDGTSSSGAPLLADSSIDLPGRTADNNRTCVDDKQDDVITQDGTSSPETPLLADSSIDLTSSFRSRSKRRHWKNLIGLSVAFVLTFSAYGSLVNLQSSLNYEAGVGLASLSVTYAFLMISCLVAPTIINRLGTKWTVAIGLICYSVYTVANFYPEYYTLVPTAAILGFAAGPLWTAQATYVTTLAFSFADVVNDMPETVVNRFNGFFQTFLQTNNIWGNLLSSVILTMNSTKTKLNQTDLWKCGRNGTGKEEMNFADPSNQQTNLLLIIYLVLGLFGGLVATIFMDQISSESLGQSETNTFAKHLHEVISVAKTPYMVLLTPLIVFSGSQDAFITGTFTKSFVSCTIGVQAVGYVMIAYGVSGAISAFGIGHLRAFVSRRFIFTSGGVVHLITILWMLLWRGRENVEQGYQFYLMAVGWGFANAVWQIQIASLIGILMPHSQEAAFAALKFWQSLGNLVSFGVSVSDNVLVLHKLWALLGLLLFSLILYYILEYFITSKKMLQYELER